MHGVIREYDVFVMLFLWKRTWTSIWVFLVVYPVEQHEQTFLNYNINWKKKKKSTTKKQEQKKNNQQAQTDSLWKGNFQIIEGNICCIWGYVFAELEVFTCMILKSAFKKDKLSFFFFF